VSRVLRRLKLNRIRDLERAPAVVRYEHAAPGDMLHLDIKRLVRIQWPSHRVTGNRRDGVKGIGAEFLHVAIKPALSEAEGITRGSPSPPSIRTRPSAATHFLAAAVA
jgi:hypothetical protein